MSHDPANPHNMKSIRADKVKPGMWIIYANARMNERIVDVRMARDNEVKIRFDYGNGGEPATAYYGADERLLVTPARPEYADDETLSVRDAPCVQTHSDSPEP
jgi:hypothetical protein